MPVRKRKFTERELQIHHARVLLVESRKRSAMAAYGKGHRAFAFTLLEWAGNARRRALALSGKEQPKLL